MRVAGALGVVVLFAGCRVRSETIDCGGWVCPPGTRCADNSSDTSRCVSLSCGDGKIDPAEDCDGSHLGAGTCEVLGFYRGELACDPATCRYLTDGCAGRCGDGVVDAEEDCDPAAEVTASCVDLAFGFDAGALACSPRCGYELSSCRDFGFDRVYETSARLSRFCAYEQAPGDVVAHLFDGQHVLQFTSQAVSPLGGPLPWVYDLACVPGRVAVSGGLVDGALHEHDGSAWRIVDTTDVWRGMADFGGDTFASVSYGGSILSSSGAGWTVEASSLGQLYVISIDSVSGGGFAGGASGQLYQRIPGPPVTWTTLQPNTAEAITWLFTLGADDVLVGTPTTVRRRQAGAWQLLYITPGPIAGASPTDLVVAGIDGMLSQFDGNQWSESVSPVGRLDDVWMSSQGELLATQASSLLRGASFWYSLPRDLKLLAAFAGGAKLLGVERSTATYVVHGSTWTSIGQFDVTGLSIVGSFAFVVGERVGRLDLDLPGTWAGSMGLLSPAVLLRSVQAIGADRAIAVGDGGALATYDAGAWSVSTIASVTLFGVAGLPGNFIAVGDQGTVLASQDGATWTVENLGVPVSGTLRAGWVGSDQTIVVGDGGTILRRASDGTWTAMTSTTTRDLYAIAGTHDDLVAVGDRVILHFDGTRWSGLRLPTPGLKLTSVAVTPRRIYVGSSSGAYLLTRLRR